MVSPKSDSSQIDFAGYCRKCGYNLRGLIENRCPECGRQFDPAHPKTYRWRPPRTRIRLLMRLFLWGLALTLIAAALAAGWWGWKYKQWTEEQRAIKQWRPVYSGQKCLNPKLKERLGKYGYVLDRVDAIRLEKRKDITDFSPIGCFTELRYIEIYETSLDDLTPFSRCEHLEEARMRVTNVKDLRPLAKLKDLKYLDLGNTQVSDVSPLADLTNLENLSLDGNQQLEDITPLSRLTKLKNLSLGITKVHDIRPLAGMSELQQLVLIADPVDQFPPMTGFKKLKRLYILGSKITDLSIFVGMPALDNLDIRDTPAADLTPLTQIPTLKHLAITKKNFTEKQVNAFKQAAPWCDVFLEGDNRGEPWKTEE